MIRWLLAVACVATALTIIVLLVARVADARPRETSYQKASRIVRAVFPDATEDAALRVVGCETGHTYSEWSYNRSGASGYFQVLQGNAGRVLHYLGATLVIPSGTKLFLPWTNTRVALFLSHGGTDWREWTCQP